MSKFYEKDKPSFEAEAEVRALVKVLDHLYPSTHEEWVEFYRKTRKEETL